MTKTSLDPYHDEGQWLQLPVRDRLHLRINGNSADVRGCITADLKAAIELIEWQAAVIAAQQERIDGKAADQRAPDEPSTGK